MTDKQIIVDDVDVSECEKLGETIDGITCGLGKRIRFVNEIITKHNLCKNNPNCYYKQLKRKEQKCFDLQKTANAYNYLVKLANYRLDKIEELQQQLDQLKETLTEIKEIAKEEIECKTYEIENDCFNKTRCKALNEHIDFTKQILQKISQCKVEND